MFLLYITHYDDRGNLFTRERWFTLEIISEYIISERTFKFIYFADEMDFFTIEADQIGLLERDLQTMEARYKNDGSDTSAELKELRQIMLGIGRDFRLDDDLEVQIGLFSDLDESDFDEWEME